MGRGDHRVPPDTAGGRIRRGGTLEIIDGLIRDRFQDATIVMVSHKGRSTIELQKRIYVEEGGAEVRE